MVRISRILKDHREAGSVNALLALWGFVDEHTFLTKSGGLGVVFRLQGADYECLDHVQRRAITHRFERALQQLDESFRVYEYLIKRPAVPPTASTHPNPVVAIQLGPIAQYVEDLALILSLIAGPDWRDPYIVPAPLGNPHTSASKAARVLSHGQRGRRQPVGARCGGDHLRPSRLKFALVTWQTL